MCCPDGHHLVVLAPHCVLPGCEVPGGSPVGPERGEFGLPRLLAGLPDHPGLWRVQQVLAPFFELFGPQGFARLVDPPPGREGLGDADLGLGVVGDGVQAGDAVLGPPPDEGLVALQPDEAAGPVDPGAQEGRDGGAPSGVNSSKTFLAVDSSASRASASSSAVVRCSICRRTLAALAAARSCSACRLVRSSVRPLFMRPPRTRRTRPGTAW